MKRATARWMMVCALVTCPLAVARAGSLNLSLDSVVDISGLGFDSVGGAAFDDATGRLWLSDSTGTAIATNLVAEIDPATGSVFSSFDASVIPNLDRGADAIAIHPTTRNLFLFSSFGESVAGEVTQAAALVQSFASANDAGAAAFSDSGTLFTLTQDDGELQRINPSTGAVEATIPLVGYTGRISAADFDPVSGRMYAFGDATDELLEINVNTGQVLSTTDVSGFLLASAFPTGFAFNADGTKLFLARGTGAGAESLIVLNVTQSTVPEPASATLCALCAVAILAAGYRRRRA